MGLPGCKDVLRASQARPQEICQEAFLRLYTALLLASLLNLRSAFAAKFTPDGKTLIYATLVGGTGDDAATSAAVDHQGDLYLAGSTTSLDMPVLNPVQERRNGLQNGFIAEVNAQGNGLVFLTYLGGSQKDAVQDLAVDAGGNIYAAGSTASADFAVLAPTQSTTPKAARGARDAFAAKLAPSGRGVIFSTLIGGSGDDNGNGVSADSAGAVYLAGTTQSADFPVSGALQATFGGQSDMFLAKIVPDAAPASPINAVPASLSFTAVTAAAAVAPQTIDVAAQGGGPAGAFTATASGAIGSRSHRARGTIPDRSWYP